MRSLRVCLATLVIGVAVAVAWGTAAVAASPPKALAKLAVDPSFGGPRQVFTVHFVARQPSGISAGQMHSYSLGASVNSSGLGCERTFVLSPTVAGAGELVAVALRPRARWCSGTFSGTVSETIRPNCGPTVGATPVACPMYIAMVAVGTFRFTVKG